MDKIDQMAEDIHDIKENLRKAFPGGDIDGHRRYHELIIAKTAAYDHMAWVIKEKTLLGLVWALIVFLVSSVWFYVVHKLSTGALK